MGIIANVYRTGSWAKDGENDSAVLLPEDYTNRGWSRRINQVVVVNAEGPFEPTVDRPGVVIVRHRTVDALHAVSVEHHESGKWTMAGGNFLYSCDSRFGELCVRLLREGGVNFKSGHFGYGAVSIHDRVED